VLSALAILPGDVRGKNLEYEVSTPSPNDPVLYNDRGLQRANAGDFDGAFADLNEAIHLSPRYSIAYHNRGYTYAKMGQHEKAVREFALAIRYSPEQAESYSSRAVSYTSLGKPDDAIADCDRAIQLNPSYANAYNNRGFARLQKEDLDRAIADFNESMRLAPNGPEPYNNRASAYEAKGDFKKAIADYDVAIRLKDNDPVYFHNRACARLRSGDMDRGMADLDNAIRLNPKQFESYLSRGTAYLDKKDFIRSIADYDQAIHINPSLSDGFRLRGFAHASKGDFDRAIADYDQALRLDPKSKLAEELRTAAKAKKEALAQGKREEPKVGNVVPSAENTEKTWPESKAPATNTKPRQAANVAKMPVPKVGEKTDSPPPQADLPSNPSSYEPDFSTMQPGQPPDGCQGSFFVANGKLFFHGKVGELRLPRLNVQKGFIVDVEFEMASSHNDDRFQITMRPKSVNGTAIIAVNLRGEVLINNRKVARGPTRHVNHLHIERYAGPKGYSFLVSLNGEQVVALPCQGDPVPTISLSAISFEKQMKVVIHKLGINWQE
jgi:tetratricopeptide (TPR) repeat protein